MREMKNQPSKEEILELFKEAIEKGNHLRWIQTAERLLKFYNGRETAHTGEDIINEIIERTVNNKRNYTGKISLDQYVFMTMKSIIDCEASKNKRIILENNFSSDGENEHVNSIIDTTTEKTHVKPNEEIELKEFNKRVWDACEGDDDAQIVLHEMQKGNYKPSDIANVLGITPDDVINIKKRIKRRVDRKKL